MFLGVFEGLFFLFYIRLPLCFLSSFLVIQNLTGERFRDMRTRRGVCYREVDMCTDNRVVKRRGDFSGDNVVCCRKRQRLAPESAGKSDFFEALPDDLVICILSKLSSSAGCPSDFINVLLTYVIVLLPFTGLVFVFVFARKLSNPASCRIFGWKFEFLLPLMDALVSGSVQIFFRLKLQKKERLWNKFMFFFMVCRLKGWPCWFSETDAKDLTD